MAGLAFKICLLAKVAGSGMYRTGASGTGSSHEPKLFDKDGNEIKVAGRWPSDVRTGSFMVRSSTWRHGDQDGGEGNVGEVIGRDKLKGEIALRFMGSGQENVFNYGKTKNDDAPMYDVKPSSRSFLAGQAFPPVPKYDQQTNQWQNQD